MNGDVRSVGDIFNLLYAYISYFILLLVVYGLFLTRARLKWDNISFLWAEKIPYAVYEIIILYNFQLSGFACILELLAEPLYILSQNLLLLRLRLVTESVATLLRCMTTYFFIAGKHDMVTFLNLQKSLFTFIQRLIVINFETRKMTIIRVYLLKLKAPVLVDSVLDIMLSLSFFPFSGEGNCIWSVTSGIWCFLIYWILGLFLDI